MLTVDVQLNRLIKKKHLSENEEIFYKGQVL